MFINSFLKTNYFTNSLYWDLYLKKDVQIASKMVNLKFIHFFNSDLMDTKWPFFISNSLFLGIFYMLLSLKRFDWALQYSLLGFLLMVFFVFMWFREMFLESAIFGKYNRKVRGALTYGFLLFIVSECFFFGGFFWAYFDRFFHPVVYLGNSSLPYGIQSVFESKKSFIATLLLVSSGVFLNYGVYLTRLGSWIYSYILYFIATLEGVLFLCIQYYEYNKVLLFNITESVYSSSFYLLTGFHGFHVIVGLIFLLTSLSLFHYRYFFSKERTMLLMISVFYWHFVDIIWIFLYLTVYVWNFNLAYYQLH